jgi:HPt (histidine-containing phosphotransfer) domain-containing protein
MKKPKTKQINLNAEENKPPLLDDESALIKLGQRQTLLYELRQVFLKRIISQDTDCLKTAYAQNDLKTIKALTHRFRGGCAYLGIPRLSQACEELDLNIKRAKKDQAFQNILSVIEQTHTALLKWLKTHDNNKK